MIFRREAPIQMTSYRNRIYEHTCMVIVVLLYMDKGLLTSVVSNSHTNKTECDNWTKSCRETCIQIK